ncbi:hypothetical protein [Pseudomonas sp. GD03746]|uniref:hypothetical protein n=1 Tax=Pseudomonas sp. GD03746 TaxID=2975378 RepID=UPI0024472545|nr:hypothetical protein [Pseudomonas sp. GD03746]MDH1574450.1 hypothetical protein [Pseudomonas sp. GD03746]HEN8711822.1 hypothetical protein [Pseudomonas putida]HEN8716756.1 hypothetical protein [Pseudomonas putida]
MPEVAASSRTGAEVSASTKKQGADVEQPTQNTQLSTLAQHLNNAAQRANERDNRLSRDELAALASRILDRLSGGSYTISKIVYDSYLPTTDDPELLARARQATAFANGRGENPFAQLPRDQLSLIAYDEGTDFTVNERRAAFFELSYREGVWSQYITQKMDSERQRTGHIDEGVAEIIAHYRSLPPIEEAQILGNYETETRLQLHGGEWPEFNASLIDMIAKEWKAANDADVKPFASRSDALPGGELNE